MFLGFLREKGGGSPPSPPPLPASFMVRACFEWSAQEIRTCISFVLENKCTVHAMHI